MVRNGEAVVDVGESLVDVAARLIEERDQSGAGEAISRRKFFRAIARVRRATHADDGGGSRRNGVGRNVILPTADFDATGK